MTTQTILLLPGDGIGPEVTDAARAVIEAAGQKHGLALAFDSAAIGGIAIDEEGHPLPDATLDKAKAADAVFLGAVGGPKWDDAPVRPEFGLLSLRKALGLFSNLRPVSLQPGLGHLSPLKPERVEGADIMIVRELTGGLYFGEKTLEDTSASDLCRYSSDVIERVVRVAFKVAQGRDKRLCSVDKANVLSTSKLWRKTVEAVAPDYPDVTLSHMLVDACAMALVMRPTQFDVIVTENLFGDILSDEASVLAGSIGLLGSASLGDGGPGLYEPIHGSAPDIAGEDKANPAGAIESAAMLLELSLKAPEAAASVRAALSAALQSGPLTGDLAGPDDPSCGTKAFTQLVVDLI